MKQHKWHKEIKAWADGLEVQARFVDRKNYNDDWDTLDFSNVEIINWNNADFEFRIKPQPKELVEDEVFEKFWNTEIISAVTGSIDHPMWGKIDKDITQAIFNYGRRYERESQKTNNTMSVRGLSPRGTRRDYSMATSPIQTFTETTHGKEPQYLYVYVDDDYKFATIKLQNVDWQYVGKIKLEVDDGN